MLSAKAPPLAAAWRRTWHRGVRQASGSASVELFALIALALCLGQALGPAGYGSPDSASYLSAAEHLLRGDGYVTSALDERGQFSALSCFAPLFSLLIAGRMWLGASALSAVADVVLASFALYAVACHALLRQLLPSAWRRGAPLVVLCLLCTHASVICLRSALSDLLGAALVLLACAQLLSLGKDETAWRCGLLWGLSVLARWSNVYLALGACLGVLCCTRSLGWRLRLSRALRLAACVLLVVGPLWLRNLVLTGAPMGPRPSVPSSLVLHLERAFEGIAQPLFEAQAALLATPWWACLHGLALAACATGIVVLSVRRRDETTDLCLCLGLSYAGLLVLSSSTTHYDPLTHPRFWLPLVPLWIGLSLRVLGSVGGPGRLHRLARSLTAVFVALFVHVVVRDVNCLARVGASSPQRSGLFARAFSSSDVVHAAIVLADEGRCELAATHAFWLYPQIGTRSVVWLTDSGPSLALQALPRCVVLLRERVEYNTDLALFQQRMRTLARQARAHLLLRDELAELWLQDPGSEQQRASAH